MNYKLKGAQPLKFPYRGASECLSAIWTVAGRGRVHVALSNSHGLRKLINLPGYHQYNNTKTIQLLTKWYCECSEMFSCFHQCCATRIFTYWGNNSLCNFVLCIANCTIFISKRSCYRVTPTLRCLFNSLMVRFIAVLLFKDVRKYLYHYFYRRRSLVWSNNYIANLFCCIVFETMGYCVC